MSRLDEIRKRVEKASDGPWGVPDSGNNLVSAGKEAYPDGPAIHSWRGMVASFDRGDYAQSKEQGLSNMEFVSHSRQDIPYLLDLVEKGKALRKSVSSDCGSIHVLEVSFIDAMREWDKAVGE